MATSPRTARTIDTLAVLTDSLARRAPAGPLWLAFSGGLDSTVLLHLLVRAGLASRLVALHVDHGLHPDSGRWAQHCVRTAASLGLQCRVERVQVRGPDGLEGNARRARYRALCAHAGGGTLITAHHRDDQSETVLLRLLRGAGPAGLAGIPEWGCWRATPLWRPLLAVSREQLRGIATGAGWCWLTDPGNADPAFDRNYLRNRLIPELEGRWPGVRAVLARAAEHQSEAAQLLLERGREDAVAAGAGPRCLPLAGLRGLSRARAGNLLRTWIADGGAGPPSAALLTETRKMLQAPADRPARVRWGAWQLRRYRQHLYLLDRADLAPLVRATSWPLNAPPPSLGCWRVAPGAGQPALWLAEGVDEVVLAPAKGGEKLLRNGLHQRVSELWRAAGVPPWRRRQWPLLYHRGRLISVPAVGVADGWRHKRLTAWHLAPAGRD